MKEVPLSRGYVALVDDEDYMRVSQHKWYAKVEPPRTDGTRLVYAARKVCGKSGAWPTQRLHQFILEAHTGAQIDHINGNGLDNRRANLRICTSAQNQWNSTARHGGTSKYKGVGWHKVLSRWQARIRNGERQICLGYFVSETEAALAYDSAAILLHGEYARPNFPPAK